MSNVNTPPANAFFYSAYGKACAVFLHQIFTNEYGIRAVYKQDDEWLYLAEPSFFLSDIDTKEKTDAAYIDALSKINDAMEVTFGTPSTEPQSGIERLQWLISTQTIVKDNELGVK